MTKQNVDLEKLNEQEWKKYREMDKVAHRTPTPLWEILVIGLIFILFIGGAFYVLIFRPMIGIAKTSEVANYTSQQLNNALNISNRSVLNGAFSYNTTLANKTMENFIANLNTHPKALAPAIANAYMGISMLAGTIVLLILLGTFLFLAGIILFSSSDEFKIPKAYISFKLKLKRMKTREQNLKDYGYTTEEIIWYHEVREQLIRVEILYRT